MLIQSDSYFLGGWLNHQPARVYKHRKRCRKPHSFCRGIAFKWCFCFHIEVLVYPRVPPKELGLCLAKKNASETLKGRNYDS